MNSDKQLKALNLYKNLGEKSLKFFFVFVLGHNSLLKKNYLKKFVFLRNFIYICKYKDIYLWSINVKQIIYKMRKGNLKKKIEEAKKVHNDFYDYHLVEENEPISVRHKTKIICPIHGVFEMSLDNHISKKQKCPKCSGVAKKNTEEFIEKCKEVHKNHNYDMSTIEYTNNKGYINVICHEKDIFGNEHGIFTIRADHFRTGHGCPKCAHRNLSNEEWIAMAEAVHGKGTYDYSLINYPNKQKEKGKFICHEKDENGIEHGIFEQSYDSHLRGCGCPKCNGGVKHNGEIFVKNAIKIHGERYKYFPEKYINAQTKMPIECLIHGIFMQTPTAHLRGEGCPFCKNSVLEDRIQRMLENEDLYFERNVYINLGKQTIDFFIPQKKVYIECQGEQHYIPTKFKQDMSDEDAEEMLKIRKQLDYDKFNKIKETDCELIYYTDVNTFHNKDVDVLSGLYNDKMVFTNIANIRDYINNKENHEFTPKIEHNVKKTRNYVTKRTRWTYEKCLEESKKYSHKSEMKEKNQSAYNVSVRYGWINEFYIDRKKDDRYWGLLENVLNAAKECTGARDMVRRFGGAYNSAVKHGWTNLLKYKNK